MGEKKNEAHDMTEEKREEGEELRGRMQETFKIFHYNVSNDLSLEKKNHKKITKISI